MGWNELPSKMFVRLISTNITTIELTHNFIAQIEEDTFRPLKSLQKLDLSWIYEAIIFWNSPNEVQPDLE
jgi:hypothetical protein